MCSFDDIVLIREPYLESSHVEAKEWCESVCEGHGAKKDKQQE